MATEPNLTPYMNSGPPSTTSASGEVSRRALLVTAGLGVCAAGVVATPIAIKYAEEQAQQAAAHALQDGIDQGKAAILAELEQLGDISIEAAITAADITKLGVKYILVPLASIISGVASVALQGFIDVIEKAQGFASFFGAQIEQLNQLHTLLTTWKNNLNSLPIALNQYATADIDSAETYLKSLKAMIDSNKTGQTSPTPTTTP